MLMGTVVGTLTCTIKDPSLSGVKLLAVRLANDQKIIIAADLCQGAGRGDNVYLLTSKEAAMGLGAGGQIMAENYINNPALTGVADAAIGGIVDA